MSDVIFDALTAEGITDALSAKGCAVTVFDAIPSTNTSLRALAEAGVPEGTVVCASSQTAGRGRMGRSFFSPDGSGIYMSLLLRPRFPAGSVPMITPAAAVAVCRAVDRVCGVRAEIKWVNDVFVGGRKVCGILTEAAFRDGEVDYAVVGIGVNVYEPEGGFPSEINGIAGAIADERRAGLRDRLCAAIIDETLAIYGGIESREFIGEYRERCFLIGKRVGVVPLAMAGADDTVGEALVVGIDGECGLMIRCDDGRENTLSSGEVRIKPIG